MGKYFTYILLTLAAVSSGLLCHGRGQDDEKYLRGIKSLSFETMVNDLGAFSFECNVEYSGNSSSSILSDLNEQLASDGFGYLLLEAPGPYPSSRLVLRLSAVDTERYEWRRIILETEDGRMHSIIQGTNAISVSEVPSGSIFPNPRYSKKIVADGCPPGLDYYLSYDSHPLQSSLVESDGGQLCFEPYWETGEYYVYNEYLGNSRRPVYLSYYDLFTEGCLEPEPALPRVIDIPSRGGVFTYETRFYLPLDSLQYSSIGLEMDTLDIPGHWTAGDGMKVRLDAVALSDSDYKSLLEITFICEPNFSAESREQNTMFYLPDPVSLLQPGDPDACLEQFSVAGTWLDQDDFKVSMSGSQPGVKYTLYKKDGSSAIALSTIVGTGYPLEFGPFMGMENHGICYVSVSYGQKNAVIGSDLDMTRPDDIGGMNYTAVRTMLDTSGTSIRTDVTYYNGLGYPVQEIAGSAGGNGQGISTPIVYDRMRRPDAKSYLPYPLDQPTLEYSDASVEAQDEYYSMAYGSEAFPSYTHRTFERYGNGRVLSVRRPGNTYLRLDKEMTLDYRLNTSDDGVLMLRYAFDADRQNDSVKCVGTYSPGTLACTRTVNEDADSSLVFVDAFGRQVLSRQLSGGRRLDTYYVYDLKDSLVCAVQPEGSAVMPESFALDGDFTGRWCFTYRYDAFGNVVSRHVPGGGHEEIFYDLRNLPVFYTDDKLIAHGRYRFVQYDQMGRTVMECYCTIPRDWTEIRILLGEGVNPYRIFNSISATVREASYYSSYESSPGAGFRPDSYTGNASALDLEHCMTLLKSETLYSEPDLTSGDFSASASSVTRDYFYDSYGRTIQVAETSSDGSRSTYSYKYDFTGNVLVSSERHELSNGKAEDLVMYYTYDNAGRRTSCLRRLNGRYYPMLSYTYDALGRLASVSAGDRVSESYAYDLQGALSRLESEAYGEKALVQILKYYDPSLPVSVPRYSGQISEVTYSDILHDSQYMSYYYDHAGHLCDSRRTDDDREPSCSHEERGMEYDMDGNLLSMGRIMERGDSTALSFSYDGNRLSSLSAGDSLWSYTWYPDGNMRTDGRRHLSFSYNWLNLPARISVGDTAVLKYTYLTDGTKVSVRDSLSGRGLKFRGSFIYTVDPDGTEMVESVAYDEGRFYPSEKTSGNSDKFMDTWFVRDYLGSVRTVLDITSPEVQDARQVVLDHSDYLPFGLAFVPDGIGTRLHSAASRLPQTSGADASQMAPAELLVTAQQGADIPQSALSRFRYNGKPEQVSGLAATGLLDYGARMYDPFAARWTTVDPMAA
ncbi:MAG: DUF6443 domain-containing protein, partial [Bacteroidales bacterium]|nr:DUF6443 domain-containing protein [Bacteroidales bacterium]